MGRRAEGGSYAVRDVGAWFGGLASLAFGFLGQSQFQTASLPQTPQTPYSAPSHPFDPTGVVI